jgi:hypothetical protein
VNGLPEGALKRLARVTGPQLRVGIDVSPLALTRAGTAARYLSNLLAALEREDSLELRRYRFGGKGAGGEARPGRHLVPGRASLARAGATASVLHCPGAACSVSAPRSRSSSRSTISPPPAPSSLRATRGNATALYRRLQALEQASHRYKDHRLGALNQSLSVSPS